MLPTAAMNPEKSRPFAVRTVIANILPTAKRIPPILAVVVALSYPAVVNNLCVANCSERSPGDDFLPSYSLVRSLQISVVNKRNKTHISCQLHQRIPCKMSFIPTDTVSSILCKTVNYVCVCEKCA